MDRKTLTYSEYLASDVWKCSDSPTHAHHWIEFRKARLLAGTFLCKYCWSMKRFPLAYRDTFEGEVQVIQDYKLSKEEWKNQQTRNLENGEKLKFEREPKK